MKRYAIWWPLVVLLLVELLGLTAVLFFSDAPITIFSISISSTILATGLLPALLRPEPDHILAGCLATVFAAFLIIPFDPPLNDILRFGPQPEDISTHLLFRLFNGAAIGPLLFQLTSRFPKLSHYSNRVLWGMYGITAGLLLIFFLAPNGDIKKYVFGLMVVWLFVMVSWSIGLLVRASRDPAPEHRRAAQQARLLIFSLLMANSGLLVRLVLIAIQNLDITYNLALAPQVFLPLGVTYAILRHDLFDIDAALRRAFAYTSLSVVLLAGYLGLTFTLTAILARTWPQFRGAAAVISVLAAAAAFEPLRGRLQRWIDQLLYPDRLKFQVALTEARSQLAQVVDRDQIIRLLTEVLPVEIGASWGWLTLAPAPDVPGNFESDPSYNAQLIVGGSSLGRYWLGPRRSGPNFSREEQSQLNGLVNQAALALAYADTIAELNDLNRQLETRVMERTDQVLTQQRALAVMEERQRLARELHDSITQTLFSINLSARVIRGLLDKDLKTATEELSGLEKSAQAASTEMRALLSQLRNPQEVDDLSQLVDFSKQVEMLCSEMKSSHNLQLALKLPGSLLIPFTLADEIRAVIREALINIAKHSGTDQGTCSVEHIQDELIVEISDQGNGFHLEELETIEGHYGLRGMRERVDSLNGRINIQSQPGTGTTIEARIPTKSSNPARTTE